MANTPLRAFRIDDELWTTVRELADQRGDNVTDIVRAALVRYSKPRKAELEAGAK